jgi:hypothetical protein
MEHMQVDNGNQRLSRQYLKAIRVVLEKHLGQFGAEANYKGGFAMALSWVGVIYQQWLADATVGLLEGIRIASKGASTTEM